MGSAGACTGARFSQVFLGTARGLDDQQSSASTQTTTAATQTSNQDAGQASSYASTAGQNSTAAAAEETADGSTAADSTGEASTSTAGSDDQCGCSPGCAEEMLEESAGVTRADVLALSEAKALTAQVITELLQGEIDPLSADTVSLDYFTFTTDEEEPPSSDDIKTQALVDSANQDFVPAGEVAGLFNETIGVAGKNYFLEGVTVGGMEISSVGNLEIAGETYVYYVTDETKTDATVYTVLNAEGSATASDTITVSYARGISTRSATKSKVATGRVLPRLAATTSTSSLGWNASLPSKFPTWTVGQLVAAHTR